eukprot:6182720-Pleurochrysis_carterae.AAC.5
MHTKPRDHLEANGAFKGIQSTYLLIAIPEGRNACHGLFGEIPSSCLRDSSGSFRQYSHTSLTCDKVAHPRTQVEHSLAKQECRNSKPHLCWNQLWGTARARRWPRKSRRSLRSPPFKSFQTCVCACPQRVLRCIVEEEGRARGQGRAESGVGRAGRGAAGGRREQLEHAPFRYIVTFLPKTCVRKVSESKRN